MVTRLGKHWAGKAAPTSDAVRVTCLLWLVALVIMGHGASPAALHQQAGLGAIKRLDLAFLVDRENHGVGERIDLEANDVLELGGEGRVFRQLELAHPMRL